jgi:hypothetical protein
MVGKVGSVFGCKSLWNVVFVYGAEELKAF